MTEQNNFDALSNVTRPKARKKTIKKSEPAKAGFDPFNPLGETDKAFVKEQPTKSYKPGYDPNKGYYDNKADEMAYTKSQKRSLVQELDDIDNVDFDYDNEFKASAANVAALNKSINPLKPKTLEETLSPTPSEKEIQKIATPEFKQRYKENKKAEAIKSALYDEDEETGNVIPKKGIYDDVIKTMPTDKSLFELNADLKKSRNAAGNTTFNALMQNKNFADVVSKVNKELEPLAEAYTEELKKKYDLTKESEVVKANKDLNDYFNKEFKDRVFSNPIVVEGLKAYDTATSEEWQKKTNLTIRKDDAFLQVLDAARNYGKGYGLLDAAADLNEGLTKSLVGMWGGGYNLTAKMNASLYNTAKADIDALSKNKGPLSETEKARLGSAFKGMSREEFINFRKDQIKGFEDGLNSSIETAEGIERFRGAFASANFEDGIEVKDLLRATGESAPTMLLAAIPYVGVPLTAATNYNQAFMSTIKQGLVEDGLEVNTKNIADALKSGKYENEAVEIASAFVQAGLEKVGGSKVMTNFAKAVGFKNSGILLKSILAGDIKAAAKTTPAIGKLLLSSGGEEFATEFAQEGIGQLSMGIQLGDYKKFVDFNAMKASGEAGGLVGIFLPGVGITARQLSTEVKGSVRKIATITNAQSGYLGNINFQAKYMESLKNDLKQRFENGEISKQDLDRELDYVTDAEYTMGKIPKGYTSEGKEELMDLMIQKRKLDKKTEGLEPELVKAYEPEMSALRLKMMQLSVKEAIAEDIRDGENFSSSYFGDKLRVVGFDIKNMDEVKKAFEAFVEYAETDQLTDFFLHERTPGLTRDTATKEQRAEAKKEALEYIENKKIGLTNKKTNYDIETKLIQKFSKFVTGGYGKFVSSNGISYAFINKTISQEDGITTTALHEVLHGILKDAATSMPNMGGALLDYMGIQYDSLTNEFKLLKPNKSYDKLVTRLNDYAKDSSKSNEDIYEETITLLSEEIKAGRISKNDTLWKKLVAFFNSTFSKLQGKQMYEFKTGEDVFDFVNDYVKEYSSSGKQNAKLKSFVEGKFDASKLSSTNTLGARDTNNIGKSEVMESKGLQTMFDKFSGDAKKMVNETLSKTPSGNYTSSLTSSALGQELGGIVETITKRLYDPIPLDNKEMLSRQEYKEALIGMAATMITNEFNPEKQTLDQFISSRLNLRANSLAKELGIESTQEQGGAGFKVEIDSNKTEGDDGMNFDEDFMSEEEADDLLDLEEQAAEQNKRLFPKFTEALDLTMEIDGKPINETLNDKMKRNLSFAMKRYDEDISKNRTITPFVETLRMEMQEDMYKDFKKYINNYPGGYAQFLTDKKEVLLANYTTTYLAKHPTFRQGIEKRVGGDWISPRKFKKDNGTIEYKWADEKGDALKIDRDNAAGRGLTSGPEFIRRNKKINDVLSTKEFVDYHFQDGGLRTKKKQNPEDAVARQLASEITLEIFQADLAENGPFSKMFEERAELLGKIVSDNALVELAKDLDRGLIKESKRLEATFNAVYTDTFNTYFTNETGYAIVKNASEMGLGSIEFDNFIKNLNIDEDIIARFIDAAISEHIYVIMEDQEVKANNLGDKYEKAISDTLGNFFKGKISSKVVRNKKGDISLTINGAEKIIELKLNDGAQFSSMTISNVFNDKKITSSKNTKQLGLIKEALAKNKVMLTAVKKAVEKAGGKISSSGQIEFATRDERRTKWEAIRDTVYKGMLIDGDSSIVMEMYADTNVDFIQIGKKGLYALNKDSETENVPMFDATMQYMIRLVPSDNKVTMRVFPLVTSLLSKSNINLEKASTISQFVKDIDYKDTKIKESKRIDEDFNKIIEETTGVESFKEFSAIVGKRRGASKGKFRFFIPPGAEDFQGLLYDLMGKGKKGEEHQKFFMKHLVEPYTFGVNQIMRTKNAIRREYGQLMKVFPKVKSKLEKQIPSKDFTYDQAIRVYLWDKAGIEIPGLTQRDQAKLVDLIKNDPELEQFSGLLSQISRQPDGWLKPGNHWDVDTILSDLNNTTEGSNRKEFLSEFVENSKEMFSDKNKNKLRAVFGNNWVDAMEDALFRMTNGTNRTMGTNKVVNAWNNWVNNSTGAIMFFNRRSAILQLLSTFNYINWSDNNPLNAAAAFANQKQYWSDFAMIFNSPMMKERRGGLQMEVSEAEIANAAANSKNKAKAVMSYLLKIGFIPTQMADSFAIASGGASMYRNRVNTYLKEVDDQGNKKYNQKEAEEKAFEDFSRTTNESQQSADPMLISQEQAGPLGRLVLAFQNTTQQYMRLSKKSLRDLINGRGDWKVHVSKIVYYTTIQNIVFNALQAGVFALIPGFGDEDDEEFDEKGKKFTAKEIAERKQKQQEEKEGDMLNGFVDGILRGAGLYGAIAATTKNVLLKYMEVEAKEKGMKDYTPVVLDAVSISPPIGSKVRKLNQAMKGRDYNREIIAERGYGVTYDGKLNLSPAWLATGQAVSAVTNFPLDRMYDETNSMIEAFDTRNTGLQRTALALGWKDWTVGATNEENDLIRSTAKKEKKEAKAKEEKSDSNVRKRRIRKSKIRK